MLSDSDRDKILTRVREILVNCSHDPKRADGEILHEYQTDTESLAAAQFFLEEEIKCISSTGTSTESPHRRIPQGRTWKRVYRDDELSQFRDIEPIERASANAGYFKGWAKQTTKALFVKYQRNQGSSPRRKAASVIREFQQYWKLNDPNVVRVCDSGWIQDEHGNECPFVATEYIDGANLHDWLLKHNNKPSLQECAEIIRVIAAALHRVSMEIEKEDLDEPIDLHLDLKPENIMVTGEDGVPGPANASTLRLVDYGATDYGTPGWRAPEIDRDLRSRPKPSPTWDTFALGCILYFLHFRKAPTLPSSNNPDDWKSWSEMVDFGNSDLNLIFRKCVAYFPAGRYQSAQQLEEDLSDWLGDRPLRHVRKDGYTWWEDKKLLFKRGREGGRESDHMQIIAGASLLTAVAAAGMGIGHVVQVANGVEPAAAFSRAVSVTNIAAFAIFLSYAYVIRFRLGSMKILEPMFALMFSFVCMIHFIQPAKYFSWPDWNEFNRHGLCTLLMIGIVQVGFAAWSPEWKRIRVLGWLTILVTFGLRPVFESRLSHYAMPIVISVVEVIGCLIFASALWSKKVVTRPASH